MHIWRAASPPGRKPAAQSSSDFNAAPFARALAWTVAIQRLPGDVSSGATAVASGSPFGAEVMARANGTSMMHSALSRRVVSDARIGDRVVVYPAWDSGSGSGCLVLHAFALGHERRSVVAFGGASLVPGVAALPGSDRDDVESPVYTANVVGI